MQVVELAHAAHPGECHLRVDGAGEREVTVRIQPRRHLVHALPPRPERAAACLRDAAQRPVKRVRVGVGEPGQRQSGQPNGFRWRVTAAHLRGDRAEPLASRFDQHVRAARQAGQPGEFGMPVPARLCTGRIPGPPRSSGRQFLEHGGERRHPGLAIGQVGMLLRSVRHTRGVADEQHRRGYQGGEHPGVVPGARRAAPAP